jgi:hypothetical protein
MPEDDETQNDRLLLRFRFEISESSRHSGATVWERLDQLCGQTSRGVWISSRVNRDFNGHQSQAL